MTRLQVRGTQFNVEDWGTGKPILLLHGFTGSTATWDFLRPMSYRLIAVDLPGHGRSDSPNEPACYRVEQTVADLLAVLDLLGLERVHLLGYSMGGRVALHLALVAPARIESLILESTSPGIEDEAERRARVRSDEALAQLLDRDGLEPFIDHWERIPLFASQTRLPAEARASLREQRLTGSAPGLANSLRGAGAGQQDSLWDRLDRLTMPALLLAGALDAKYCAIASRMAAIMPRAQMVIVPEVGHAIHLEAPGVIEREIVRFLGDVPPPHLSLQQHSERQSMTTIQEQSPVVWHNVRDYEDILYEKSADGIAKITINRPEVRNAFRPKTLFELLDAFDRAHEDNDVGVILFTGAGDKAFCSGGDQRVRGEGGYVDNEGVPRLNVLELQRRIRYLPKPVIAVVAGYAIGGGHVLHLVCDLTIAADNAIFGQTGPKVGSFDAGYGATLLARTVGQKKAKEIWFLCRQYDAHEALDMGLVNTVVPLDRLEAESVQWAREILTKSPMALRFLKAAFNADTDGLAGLQQLAGDSTLLYYMTEEAKEGKNAFLEKRTPDFSKYPRFP